MKKKANSSAPLGNVLILANYRAPQSGNFISSLLDLGDKLRNEGSQAIYLFPDNGEGYGWTRWIEERGFPYFLLDDQLPTAETRKTLEHITRNFQISLMHSHFGFLSRTLLQNHKALGVELLFHDHMDFSELGSQKKQHLATMKRGLMYKAYDAYCISVMEKKNRYYWTSGSSRHWYVPNGLSLQRAELDPLPREERREEIGIGKNEKLVLFLGWDMHRKGLDVAAKAVRKYRESDPSLKLGVIGVGKDGKPIEAAQEFLISVGVNPFSDWIIYMHSYEDIFALNRAVDCYISSSRAEAFSYGILEAISQNTPVVVSDIEGTGWSWEYSNCFRYSTEDVDDCVSALQAALKKGRVASNAQMIVTKYGNDIWCERVLSIYRKIMG